MKIGWTKMTIKMIDKPVRTCPFCAATHTASVDCCMHCYYEGAALTKNFKGTIEVLNKVTGTEWFAWHSGGGCFMLRTDIAEHGTLALTSYPDVLGGFDTIEVIDIDGWFLGAYTTETWDGEDDTGNRYWPNNSDLDRGLHHEQLPEAVLEAVQWLKECTAIDWVQAVRKHGIVAANEMFP